MKKFTKLLLLAAAIATIGLLTSSCFVVGDTKIRYVWESSQQHYIVSIAASFTDVDYWYKTVWSTWPEVPLEVSKQPKWEGSTEIPNNIYSSNFKSTQYKGVYFPISQGEYTAICTVDDPIYGDTYDIVANYKIKEYLYAGGDPSETYYELAFDVRRFLNDDNPNNGDKWWYLDEYDNKNTRPSLTKTPTSSKPFLKVFEDNNVTYLVFRRPTM
jgi:hypothetical protein